jgi:signal peptidase II
MVQPTASTVESRSTLEPAAGQASPGVPPPAETETTWERPGRRYGFLLTVTTFVFAIDQLSKAIVSATMAPGDVIPLIPPVLDLHRTANTGVAFGLFQRFGNFFVPVAIVIMAFIFAYYRSLHGPRLWLRTALGLQLGGALGNLVDRLRFGSVVDFIDFHIPALNFQWYIFNLADSAIVIGTGILLFCLTQRQED